MKITLISPYAAIYSVGVRILSACLKKEGHDVNVIFLQGDFLKRYNDNILNEAVELSRGSGLIGISLTTNYFDNAVQITHTLKRSLNTPVLWGGVHPTVRPQECLEYADMICIGEGEESLVELAKKIECGYDYQNVQGIWLKREGNIIANERRALLQDMDSIPFPDYDYETHYIIDDQNICRMSKALLLKYTVGNYMTMATRGCPFGCSYCFNNTLNKIYLNQKFVRKRSIDNIIKELTQVKLKLPLLEYIYFDDDAFFLYTTDEMKEFNREYKKNINLPYCVTGVTPLTLTEEKLSLLVEAGLEFIRMGIQTGSKRTKRLYNRNYSNEQVLKAVVTINKFKDEIEAPTYDIILDNPWETDEDLIETLIFSSRFPPPFQLNLFSLTFYPGTELYDKAKSEGIIVDDLQDVYRKSFHGCKKTYLNKLFFLLNMNIKHKISTKTMSLLTNKALRKLNLHWILYYLIYFRERYCYLLSEAIKDIRKGHYDRIMRYLKIW